MMNEEAYKQEFLKRVQKHINSVNQFAQKLGLSYPQHDNDKLSSPLLDVYYLDKKSDYVDLTDEEEEKLLQAGMNHRLNNPHHPEYWDKGNIESMTGLRGNPTKLFNVENMPQEALEEMCCDWCAMSKEFGNTPFEWYNHIKGKRYNFTPKQEQFILKTLKKLWYSK